MDKLADRLRRDADDIEVVVSDELDRRIAASLQGITPQSGSRPPLRRPAMFWWASSVTGIAAAAAVIVIVNSRQAIAPATSSPSNIVAAVPAIDWKTETAMFTRPLEKELDDLQADIRKAERKVKQEIGF